jgi:hypothetical protein
VLVLHASDSNGPTEANINTDIPILILLYAFCFLVTFSDHVRSAILLFSPFFFVQGWASFSAKFSMPTFDSAKLKEGQFPTANKV